jgi:hypothetical protein
MLAGPDLVTVVGMLWTTPTLFIVFAALPGWHSLRAQRQKPAARAPAPPPGAVAWWNGTFPDAKTRARERNCPIVVMALQDGEEASERWFQAMPVLPELGKLLEGTVPVVTCPEAAHATRTENNTTVCSRLGAIPCDRHHQLAVETFELLKENDSVKTPQFMVLDPDGKVLERIHEVPGVQAYADALKKAGKQLGPSYSVAEHARIRQLVASAQGAAGLARPGLLLLPLDSFFKRNVPGRLQTDILAARDLVRAELDQRGNALAGELAAGKVFEAYRAARFLELDGAGLPAAQKARTVLDACARRPDLKELRARVDREVQAFAALEKARDLVAKGGAKTLGKDLETILKLAAGTPAETEIQDQVAALKALGKQ